MKKLITLITIGLLIWPITLLHAQSRNQSNLQFSMGYKMLDSTDWGILDNQLSVGFSGDVRLGKLPVNLVVGYLLSHEEDTIFEISGFSVHQLDVTGRTSEFRLGLRKYVELADAQASLFFGSGVTSVTGEISIDSYFSEGSGIGYYVEVGVKQELDSNMHLGLKVDYSAAQITMNSVDGEAGGFLIAAFAGISFKGQ